MKGLYSESNRDIILMKIRNQKLQQTTENNFMTTQFNNTKRRNLIPQRTIFATILLFISLKPIHISAQTNTIVLGRPPTIRLP